MVAGFASHELLLILHRNDNGQKREATNLDCRIGLLRDAFESFFTSWSAIGCKFRLKMG